jgi:DNA-binding transcriptional LysR family regulator
MRLTLDGLQVLDAIDRKGSFAAAARELNRVPSALTYSIQQLEQDLDVLLFDRRGHRAQLTPAGHELLGEGRRLLRAAADLECRIQQVATGWETELHIAVDTVIGSERLFPLLDVFYRERTTTRIKVSTEVLGGCWDALADERADLVIGASGDAPSGLAAATLPLGRLPFAFVAAPGHPIHAEPMPLSQASIGKYRAVSVADSSRHLPPRTTGLLGGQDVLTLPTMAAKLAAHVAGLGVGFLPLPLAEREAEAGRLVILPVEIPKPAGDAVIAWRPNRTGKALRWFIRQLESGQVRAGLTQFQGNSGAGNENAPSAPGSNAK